MKRAAAPKGKTLLAFWMAWSIVCSAQVRPQGTVHIYRYRLTVSTASHPTVSCDMFPVVKIQNGRIHSMQVSAGRHTFTAGVDQTGVKVDVEGGKEYFVRIDLDQNARYRSDAKVVLVPPEQGSMETLKMRRVDGQYIQAATCGNP
jgi:hypothetical protein